MHTNILSFVNKIDKALAGITMRMLVLESACTCTCRCRCTCTCDPE
jgi:hypothetical protein